MHNYNYTHNTGNRRDGLVYTIPKKVKSIGFAPNGGRLCISKITIYNKEGKIINTYLKEITEEKVDKEKRRNFRWRNFDKKTTTSSPSPTKLKVKKKRIQT